MNIEIPIQLANEIGAIFYSNPNAISCGNGIYFLGLNPGGVGENTIQEQYEIAYSKPTDWNEYLNGQWSNNATKEGELTVLQQRYLELFESILNMNPNKVVCSNLIFHQTVAEKDLRNKRQLADDCFPVHEQVFKSLNPHTIIVFGSYPFHYLKKKLHFSAPHKYASGHGNWKCLWSEPTSQSEYSFSLVGLPHLSRYKPNVNNDPDGFYKKLKLHLQALT